MNGNEWIAELKVGDSVYTTQRLSALPAKGVVVRTTPRQVMIDFGGRRMDGTRIENAYWIKNGQSVCSDIWNRQSLMQATPEMNQRHFTRVRNGRAKAMLSNLTNREFTLDQSEAVIAWCAAMIEETNKKEGG